MSLSVQLQTVGFMALCGVLMGMGYDTYRVCTRGRRIPPVMMFVLDVLFWLAGVALVFFVLLRVNSGIVRFPIFLGMAAGAYTYFTFGSTPYIQLLLAVIKCSKWLYRTLLLLIDIVLVQPLLFVYRVVWMVVSFVLSLLLTVGRGLGRVLFVLVRPFVTTGQKMGKRMNKTVAGVGVRLKNWIQRKRTRDD